MKNILRNRNFYKMILLDAILVTAAFVLAYLLRFDGHISPSQWISIKNNLPFLIPLKLLCFFMFGLYRGMWRYTGLVDLKNILKASSLASIIIVLIILCLYRFQGYPRSIYIIDWGFTFLFVTGIRVFVRLFFEGTLPFFGTLIYHKNPSARNLLIIGAGDAGEKVLREILETLESKFKPIGLLDDDPVKQGKSIHGIPVLGTVDDIKKIRTGFDEILIAIPSVSGEKMRRIVSLCEETGKRFRTVPGIWELIEGKVSVKVTRKVHLEDLLDREEVHLNEEEIREYLKDKRILIHRGRGIHRV